MQTAICMGQAKENQEQGCYRSLWLEVRVKISGVLQFYELTASGGQLVQEFQREHSDLSFQFAPNSVSVRLESFANLASLTRLAATLEAQKPS